MRFHPSLISQLFPSATVAADGDQRLAAQMGVIANVKIRSSWQAGGKAMIPPPERMTVDMDIQRGLRQFFDVDTGAAVAHYYSNFEPRFVPIPPAITATELAAAAFDQPWEAFDKDYAMFVLRPEVDWAALKAQKRPLALASGSTYEFAGVCADMLKPLRDLHVWLTVSGAYVPVFDRPRPYNANPYAYQPLLGSLNTSGSSLQWTITSDKIGFMVIYSWSDSSLPELFDEALESMRDTRGLIVDVRFNGGGSEPLAQKVAARFVDRQVIYAYSQYRNGPQHTDLTDKSRRSLAPRGPFRYDRPVALLIGQRCMSSNESFIAMMTCATQVVTMGDHTAGSRGNPEIIELPLSMTVSVPRWIDYLPDATPLDEKGIVPQVPFTASADAFQGERDDLLSAALQRLMGVPLPEEPIEARGLVLRGQWPGYHRDSAKAVGLSGNYAYVAAGGLHVVDISDPSNPKRLGGFDTSRNTEGVAVAGQHAYVIDAQSLHVLDVADPGHPRRLGTCDIPGRGTGIALSGNYAYVTTTGLSVIDITNPTQPKLVGQYKTPGAADGVAVSGNYAYVVDGGLQVIDITHPNELRWVGQYDAAGDIWTVTVAGKYALVAGSYQVGFQVVDISDPAQPRHLGSYATAWLPNSVAVSGSFAYLVSNVDGLVVLDISDPTQPKRIGGYGIRASGVQVSGSYAYLAEDMTGLQVIDISAPANPRLTGWCNTSSWIARLAVSGEYAYVVEGYAGVQVLDVGDPALPRLVGNFASSGNAKDVAVADKYAYVADSGAGLKVFDLSNP